MFPGSTSWLLPAERVTRLTFTTGRVAPDLLGFRGQHRFAPLSRKIAHEKAHHNQAGQQQRDQHQADGGGAPIRVVARRVQVSSALPIAASVLQFRTAAGLR